MAVLPAGLGNLEDYLAGGFTSVATGGDGRFQAGVDGVRHILTPADRKADFLVYDHQVLVYVKSALGSPALYPLEGARLQGPAKAVLMDLDGTSVHSEKFWIALIEKTTARLAHRPRFTLDTADVPHVMGHSVSEHLSYCLAKYAPHRTLTDARAEYFALVEFEMAEIAAGRGWQEAFEPAPFLREFLLTLKDQGVKIGLVTSGLYAKAWPEILAAFRQLDLGDPLEFYDAIITAGTGFGRARPGAASAGTLGELSPKPHPWLYAETGRVGLGLGTEDRQRVLGVEDSSAGVLSVRLAGYPCVAVTGGNVAAAGYSPLVQETADGLERVLALALGR